MGNSKEWMDVIITLPQLELLSEGNVITGRDGNTYF